MDPRHRIVKGVGPLGAGVPVWLVCATMLVACGDGGGQTLSFDEFQQRLTEEFCGTQVRCGLFPDVQACDERFFTKQQIVTDIRTGKVRFDGRQATECLKNFDWPNCKLSDGTGSNPAYVEACQTLVVGTVTTEGACLDNAECVSLYCDRTACLGEVCCAGTCKPKVAAGGACSGNGDCVSGTYCQSGATGMAARCAPAVAPGEACSTVQLCVAGYSCEINPLTREGICAKPPSTGAPCTQVCDSFREVCDVATHTCVPRIEAGGSCSSSAECGFYAHCDPTSHTCVWRRSSGEACVEQSDCFGDCVAGVCAAVVDTPACP